MTVPGTASPHPGTDLRTRILDGISTVLPHVLDGPVPELSPGTRLLDDLGLTSASTLEFMLELEDVLDLQVDVEEITPADLASIGSLADYIVAHSVLAA